MPAKKKAAPRNAAAAKKRTATKKRVPAKKAAPRKKAASPGAIPDSVRAMAERSAEAQRASKSGPDAPPALDTREPEEIRDDLADASRPGHVVAERMSESRSDTLTLPEPEPITRVQHAERPRPRSSGGDVMIDVENVHVFYGAVQALRGISFRVHEGETVAIIGSNGAGKTTTLKTVSGVSELLKTVRGHITLMGRRVESWPAHKIARLGVAHSPEGRKVFPNQTVRDNLMLGAFGRSDSEIDSDIAKMEERFPILGQRRDQHAGLLSGGEQQMLAMGRALMARPKILLFDEPSMGLAPLIVKQIFEIIQELKNEGKTILLVEQMAFQALAIADRGYVLETGEITMEGRGSALLDDPRVKEAYLGA